MADEGNAVRSHRDLEVWQEAVGFAVAVCRATEAFPKSELYGLTNQLRRAAVSVGANIAEGSGRKTTKDFVHFLYIARGSLREVDTLLEVSERLGFVADFPGLRSQGDTVGRLLSGLTRSLERRLEP